MSEPRTKATHPTDAPTRATTLPEGAADRKKYPVASGVLDYFPDALVAVARVSYEGNEQHNPGEPLHWARGKSTDQDDTIIRHFLQRGLKDSDGQRHSAKLAWRALALLQLEIEAEQAALAGPMNVNQPNRPAIVDANMSRVCIHCSRTLGDHFGYRCPVGSTEFEEVNLGGI